MTFVPRTAEELREGFPPEIDHLSASSITQLLRCPEQFRITRLEGRRSRPGAAQLWGRADSEAMALHFQKQIRDGEGLGVEDVQDAFVTALNREVAHEGPSEIDWNGDPAKTRAKMTDNGAYLAGLYRREVAPYVVPIGAELKFEVQQTHWPVPVIGYLDVETADRVIERKSASRNESKPKGDWIVQGHIYQMVKRKDLAWHMSVRNDNKLRQMSYGETAAFTLHIDEQRDKMTDLIVVQAIDTVRHFYSTYGPDNPWPGALTHTWACQYCGFRPTCAWHV